MAELVIPEDGMSITRDTVLRPGVYHLPNGLSIAKDGVTLDGNGALIIGDDFKGRGVSIDRRVSVTVKNLRVARFYHGIWVNASANVQISNNQVTHTHELPSPDTFLDVWLPREQAYGGGIFLSGVIDSFVIGNDARHQQNGIMLYGCNRVEISNNDASYNSGYGILLFESSENIVENNTADFCCRVYAADASGERYHNGADAAALVIMCSSSKNIIRNNRLRSSGDGVFLGGFHRDQIKVPCNDNLFENNDGSFSPNIAFEATFSRRNIFRSNRADNCAYGFWLGWSSETTVEGNSIKHNRIAGVAIEHGHRNTIVGNAFERNGVGVQLWVNADAQRRTHLFREFYPECADSYETHIVGNTFVHNDLAIHAWTERDAHYGGPRCRQFNIHGNRLHDNRVGVLFERVRDSLIRENVIRANLEAGIKLVGCRDVNVEGNEMD
ncbi:MAG: right-handed parallel beta-helix repeat-containing protein [Thermoflexales bacterium]|nr:right-handed parallel beta-helix repeat-containing protein [Thermoflexales bacterium]MDW8350352.1 NosD domain-containing protein [Anaerolineae bacterium]